MKQLIVTLAVVLIHLSVLGQTGKSDSASVSKPDPAQKTDYSDDWAQLRKYQQANRTLPAGDTNSRVVFLGSSIFEFWSERMPAYFQQHPNYINRGISGQISGQLLIRFQQDVIALHPKAVIILAGSNDISGDRGHVTDETILNNVRSMVELARLHHIIPVICLYVPVGEYPWRKEIQAIPRIKSLNENLAAFAKENKLPVLDYFSPLVDEHNAQKAELTIDGVHPNKAGYEKMAKATDAVLSGL
ncbi:MAG: acylhydrolase [Chitinophagaceae bacterium]|nr:MAG: acylhydrolase [Chitinophagaceae bacterium]